MIAFYSTACIPSRLIFKFFQNPFIVNYRGLEQLLPPPTNHTHTHTHMCRHIYIHFILILISYLLFFSNGKYLPVH